MTWLFSEPMYPVPARPAIVATVATPTVMPFHPVKNPPPARHITSVILQYIKGRLSAHMHFYK